MTRLTTKFAAGLSAGALVATLLAAALPSQADACGCFTPPDPSVPIVQAGERILFSYDNGKVNAHIQVQYNGPAEEFGWLLPLPALPEMGVGTDELFAQLIAQTQPLYRLDQEFRGDCSFDPSRNGGGLGNSSPASEDADGGSQEGGSPLVLRDTVGPYDFAVLRADSKEPMFEWLAENGFFVPDGTEDVVGPYIKEGGYFLALKLLKGNDIGDLQPVVLTYEADYPMIPILLTSVAADPDMGVQVWVLGEHRAIPRNYFHTKINDAMIDWLNAGQNYVEVITDAVDEAEGHHSFVTEYAGTSNVMLDVLDPEWRFGDLDILRTTGDAISYIQFLNNNGFPTFSNLNFNLQYTSQTLAVLQKHLPVPAALLDSGVTANDYYTNINWYLGYHREENPELYLDLDIDFDPVLLTNELDERVVTTKEAGKLFRDNSYLSRLFTTLSPHEMTKDPVFSFNPDLKEVTNLHSGLLTYYCGFGSDDPLTTRAAITTEDGFVLNLPDGTGENPWSDTLMPASRYTEILREEGEAEVVSDNTNDIEDAINDGPGSGGCAVGHGGGSPVGLVILLGFAFIALLPRRQGKKCD